MTRLRASAAAALVVAAGLLSACVVDGGGLGPTAGASTGREVLLAGRDACTRQAQRQGLAVAGVRDQQLTGAAGRPAGARIDLNVSRAGRSFPVRCDYDHARRNASISGIPGAGAVADDNAQLLRAAREACIAQARRDGWRINQVRSEAVIDGSGGRSVGAALNVNLERRGVRTTGRCEWTRATDRAVLRVEAEPVRGDRVLAAAREACIAEARDRGLRVNQVRSSTLTLDRGGRITGADLHVNVEDRGGRRSARQCVYTQSDGRVRLRTL